MYLRCARASSPHHHKANYSVVFHVHWTLGPGISHLLLIIRVFWNTRHEFLQHLQITSITAFTECHGDPDLHLMDLLLELRADALLAPDHSVQVPPPPPLPGHGDCHQHRVDGHSRGGGQEGDTGQGRNQESKRVSLGSAITLCG